MTRPAYPAGSEVLVPVRAITRDGCCGIIDSHWSVVFDPEMLIDGCLRGVVEPSPCENPHTEQVRLVRFAQPEPNGCPMIVAPLRANLRPVTAAPQMERAA